MGEEDSNLKAINSIVLSKISAITVVLKPKISRTPLLRVLQDLVQFTKSTHKTMQFLEKEEKRILDLIPKKSLSHVEFIAEKDLYRKTDLFISLGGDGTLINLCRKNPANHPIPVMGVNLGNLGFITEFQKESFLQFLKDQTRKPLKLISYPVFSASIIRDGKTIFQEPFINDAVCTKDTISRMCSLKVSAPEGTIFNFRGDGIIISGPLGSTAYSLSAGGPIIHPAVQTLLLSPICPHGLTFRPLAIPDTKSIQIEVQHKTQCMILTLDGQSAVALNSGDIVEVKKKARTSIVLVANPQRSYFKTLKEKFFHGK
jgi:NAD+ kinase